MKIKCDKELLMDNISLVQKAVSSRTSTPILECFLLTCTAEGFRLISTDQEIGIKTELIECEIIEEGSIALPSKFFSEIIRRLPDGIVTIHEENLITKIKCQSSEFKIVGRNPEEFPELPEIERENEYKISQKILKALIKNTYFSMCQDETKPHLMGALIEIDKTAIRMVTCDSYRVSYKHDLYENSVQNSESIIVPTKTINEVHKLLIKDEANVLVYITPKHILFDIGNCTVVSRLIEGEFINYTNIFPDEFGSKMTVKRNMITEALERASLVSYYENKKNPVRMRLENSTLIITTASETGNSNDELQVEHEGKDIEIAFNPKFLLDAVKTIEDDEITFEFNTNLSPCVIKSAVNNESCKYLVLPLRLR